jgi:hypothetical protein
MSAAAAVRLTQFQGEPGLGRGLQAQVAVRLASAGLDVPRRSSWSSGSASQRNRCLTVEA